MTTDPRLSTVHWAAERGGYSGPGRIGQQAARQLGQEAIRPLGHQAPEGKASWPWAKQLKGSKADRPLSLKASKPLDQQATELLSLKATKPMAQQAQSR